MALSNIVLSQLTEPIPEQLRDDINRINHLDKLKKMKFANKLQFINELNNFPIFYFKELNIKRNAWTNHVIFLYRLENLYHLCINLPQEYVALWNYQVLPKKDNYTENTLEKCFIYALNWGSFLLADQLLFYVDENERLNIYPRALNCITNINTIKHLVEMNTITPIQAIERLADNDINLPLIKELVQQVKIIHFDTFNNALKMAIKHNQIEITTYLITELQAGMTIFDENLDIIIKGRFTPILKLLLNSFVAFGGNIISTLFEYAIDENDIELFKLIEDKGGLLDYTDDLGRTLGKCCSKGRDDFIIHMLDKYQILFNEHPFYYFSIEGNNNLTILEKFIERGYDPFDVITFGCCRDDDDYINLIEYLVNEKGIITIEQIYEKFRNSVPPEIGLSIVKFLVKNGKTLNINNAKREIFEYLKANNIPIDVENALITMCSNRCGVDISNEIEFFIENGATNLEEAFTIIYNQIMEKINPVVDIKKIKILIEAGYDPPQYMLNSLLEFK